MKQLFYIAPDAEANAEEDLVCELSHYHICFASLVGNRLSRISYYESSTPVMQQDLRSIMEKEVPHTKHFKSLLIGSAFPDYTLVPQNLAAEKDLDSFLQQESRPVFTDTLNKYGLQVVYSFPPYLLDLFPRDAVHTIHVHTAALHADAPPFESALLLHFTSKEFRVLAIKEGQLQLAQVYPFSAPLDVVYYLLMISAQYGMPQDQMVLALSGLIDERSALYKELLQYYSQVQLHTPQGIDLPPTEYQSHYFSSILNLAACASLVAS